MVKMPDIVQKAILKQEISPVATSASTGMPNVVYVRYLKVIDDSTVLIADNYFDKTRDNILSNGRITFVVMKEDKGSFQLKGSAKWVTEGPMFDEMRKWVPEKYPRVAAVVMTVEQIYSGSEIIV